MFRHVLITDDVVFQATLDAWTHDVSAYGDAGVFLAGDIESRLRWQRQQAEETKDAYWYFIVENGQNVASSLIEVVHAMPRSDKPWLKLLDIDLKPSLVAACCDDVDGEALRKAARVLGTSIAHAIGLIFSDLPSRELKVYGRTSEMMMLFRAIVSMGSLDSVLESAGLSVRLESKWLVLARR